MNWFEDFVEGCGKEERDEAMFDCSALSRAILEKLEGNDKEKVKEIIESLGVTI